MAETPAETKKDAEEDDKVPNMQAPSARQRDRYTKKQGSSNMAGELYEMKLATLLFIRCLIEGQNFKIATNMNSAGTFDDIVLGLSDKLPILMQLKHRSSQGKAVYDNQFTQLKGDFALLKYCETFWNLKQTWDEDLKSCGVFEKCVFILYTNATVICAEQRKSKEKNKSKSQTTSKAGESNQNAENIWQKMLNTGRNFFPILQDTHPKIYKAFKDIQDYKRILRERNNAEEVLRAVRALGNKDAVEVPSESELDKLAADLGKLKGIDCYEEFLPRVWVFGAQANEQKLNSLIENDIKTLFGITCSATSKTIAQQLLDGVQKWWQYDNRFLTEDIRLWQEVLQSRMQYLSETVMNVLLKLPIEFEPQEIKHIKEALSTNGKMIQVLAHDSPVLSCLKIFECLKERKYIFVNRETFERHHDELMSYSKRNIVLVILSEDDDFGTFIKALNDSAMKIGNWKVIIVSKSDYKFETIQDCCNASQLDEKSKEIILIKCINFQGQEVPLKYIIGQDDKSLSLITGEAITQLMTDNKKLSVGNAPSKIIDYFINRTLQRKDNIGKEIFEEKGVFAITDIRNLQQFVPKGEMVRTFNSGDVIDQTCRFFEIKTIADFEELSKAFKNIHCLQRRGDFFHWIQSKGNVQIVKKHITRGQVASSCDNVLKMSERLILLVAEPGMGKSTLMSYIALEMKKLKSTHWVVKVNLNDHGEYLGGNSANPLGLLERAAKIQGDLQKNVLQHSLNVVGNIAVLFDGFDEISPDYADQVIEIMRKLVVDTRIEQIWITSRPVMKEKLEETFSTFSYVLKPFSREDQKRFLHKFWNAEYIEGFCNKLLEFTCRWLNDKLGQFTGIPLQTMMLAEAFREEMLHFKNTGVNRLPERLDLLQLYEKFIDTKLKIYFQEKLNVDMHNVAIKVLSESIRKDFYEKHMVCAILSLLSQEELTKLPCLQDLKEGVKDFLVGIQEGKEKTGIITSINNEKPTFIHRTFEEYFAALWLVRNYKKCPELVEHLLFSPTYEIMRIFFDRALTRNCTLHVAILNQDRDSVKQLVTSEPTLLSNVDEGGRVPLHIAIMNFGNGVNDKDVKDSRYEILEALLNGPKINVSVRDEILGWTPLKYADKIYAWQAVNILLLNGADQDDMAFSKANINDETFLRITLRQTLMRGFKEIIAFLLSCKPDAVDFKFFIEVDYMETTARCWVTPLHEAIFRGHREIIELLLKNGASLEVADSIFGETPLLWCAKEQRWDIFDLLVNKGADVTARSKERGTSVLHFVAKSHNTDLLRSLVQNEVLLLHVNSFTGNQHSPVWEAAKAHHWTNVRILLEKGVSVHCVNAPKGNTLLHLVAKTGDNDTMCFLLQYPEILKQINVENEKGETSIEWAARAGKWDLVRTLLNHGVVFRPTVAYYAASQGNIDIMEHLLETPGIPQILSGTESSTCLLKLAADSEQWDMFRFLIEQGYSLPADSNTTVLHMAAKSYDPDLLHFALDHLGLDVDVVNREHETALMCAARDGNLLTIESLLERGASPLTVHPAGGYTALHLGAECDKALIVRYLLENTDLLTDINRKDAQGQTPLMRALPRKHGFGVSQCLVEFGADCTHRYDNRQTLMHAVARNGKLELGRLLIEHGVSPLERDNKGQSPLHVAASRGKVFFVEWLVTEQGANVDEMDDDERTPLLWAIGRNHQNYVEVAEILLKNGANPNQPTKTGKFPLHLAAFSQGMVKVLLQWGAKPDVPDPEGRSPLHHAAFFDMYPVVELLVKHGADPNRRDKCGKTPLDVALEVKAAVKTRTKKRSTALNFLEKVTNKPPQRQSAK